MATCQKMTCSKTIDGTLRPHSQLDPKRTCSMRYIFSRFATLTLCIKIALTSKGNSLLQRESKTVPQGNQDHKLNSLVFAPGMFAFIT